MAEFIDIYLPVFFTLLFINICWRAILWGRIFGHNWIELLFPKGNIDLFEYNQVLLFPTKIDKDIIADHFESSRKKFNVLVTFYYWGVWLPLVLVGMILLFSKK